MRCASSLLFLTVGLSAATCADEPVTITFDANLASRYQWRGLILSDGPVFQPSIDFTYRGWSLNFWGSMELSDANMYDDLGSGRNRFTEWDTTLTYSFEHLGNSFQIGYTYYDYPNTGFQSSNEVFAIWSREAEITPYAEVFYDFDQVKGVYVRVGADKSWPVGNGSLTLGAALGWGSQGYNESIFGTDRAALTDLGLSLTYEFPINDRSQFRVFACYQTLIGRDLRDSVERPSHFAFGVGYSVSF